MSLSELHGSPGHLIRRAQQLHSALFAEELAGLDLTSVQYALLVAIQNSPGGDATRLAAQIYFDRATTGDVLNRLAEKGLVSRNPSPKDGRVKVVLLTPAGERLLAAAGPLVARVQERLLEKLSADKRPQLTVLLRQLLGSQDDESTP